MHNILPRNESLSLADVIRLAADYLDQHDLVYGHGTGSPVDDAAWLSMEAAGLSPLDIHDQTAVYPVDSLDRLETWLRKRAENRIPSAYLVGRIWFAGYEFRVDPRALIPRSPLAELINNRFLGLFDEDSDIRVLDLCTGGGCIALAVALAFPGARVVATDLSADALALAAVNRRHHRLTARVELLEGDLFESVGGRFDLILSNPPYVDALDMQNLAPEFHHEPSLGLSSGADGLDFTRRMLAAAGDYLTPDGILIGEVGNSAEALVEAFPKLSFQWLPLAHGGHGVFMLTAADLTGSAS